MLNIVGWVASLNQNWWDRLLQPSLDDVICTILALVIVIATCLLIVVLRYS